MLRVAKLLQKALASHKAGYLQEAEALYQSILKKYPNHPDAIHFLGVIAHQAGKNDLAIARYKQALAIKPDYAEVHNSLGNTLQVLGRMEEAIACYEQALAIKSDFAQAHNNLGLALQEMARMDEAIACYEQALAIKPDFTEAHNNLGNALQALGRMDEAIACYEQALAIKPDNARAHRGLTMIKPKQEQVPIIEKLLTKSTVSDEEVILYQYALGNIFNDTKSYARAFEHYHKANTYKRKTITYDSHQHSVYVDRLIKVYSKSYFQVKTTCGSDSELPVFIIGMPRSGTTLVEQIISSHPQVYGAGELVSFRRVEEVIVKQFEAPSTYPECMPLCNDSIVLKFSEEYLKELDGYSQNAKRISDKMPDNFLRTGLIKTLFPHARIIHCQRNAMDICTSMFLNYFAKGNKYSFDLTEIGQYYLDYTRLMEHWSSLFPSEILDVQYEELVTNQEIVSQQLIEYLGLEWDEKCLTFHNNKRAVKTTGYLQVRQPI